MAGFAAAISEHPVSAIAAGEVTGDVLERLGEEPDLAVLFVTQAHAGALEDIAGVVRSILRPRRLIGCAAESVAGSGREVEGGSAVALWAGAVGDTTPLLLDVRRTDDGLAVLGWPDDFPADASAVLLIADPFSFPAEAAFELARRERHDLPVVGGNASAAAGPGGNRLLIDGEVVQAGAVGCVLGPSVEVAPLVSQGCAPVGVPWTVTATEGPWVLQLGGESALARLAQLLEAGVDDTQRASIQHGGLHLGVVVDETKAVPGRGDFLVRNVAAADRERGALAAGPGVEVGSVVQFHVRDADSADDDLRAQLAGRSAEAALLFTCNGRGTRLFTEPHHDAGLIDECLDRPAVAGFFAQGEFGPVGGRNFVHGFTASVLLFGGRGAD